MAVTLASFRVRRGRAQSRLIGSDNLKLGAWLCLLLAAAWPVATVGEMPAEFPVSSDLPGVLPLLWAWVLFVGLCVGSFLNVVIHRLPLMEHREAHAWARELLAGEVVGQATGDGADDCAATDAKSGASPYDLMRPGSACPKCGRPIRAIENIPVLSWLALRGRCRGCDQPISLRYPLIELFTSLLTVLIFLAFGFTVAGLLATFFTWALIALAMIDVEHMELPDAIVYPLLWLGLLANVGGIYVPLSQAVVGAAIGYLSLWSLHWAFKLLAGKDGMGYGDFKLMAAMGAWLGWAALPSLLMLSSLSGLVAFVLMRLTGHLERGQPLPFGPAIALAGWLALVLPGLAPELAMALP